MTRTASLAIFAICLATPLAAQTVVTEAVLDPVQIELRDELYRLRDTLTLVEAATAVIARDLRSSSDQVLRSRARTVSERCKVAATVVPPARVLVTERARPMPDVRKTRAQSISALEELRGQAHPVHHGVRRVGHTRSGPGAPGLWHRTGSKGARGGAGVRHGPGALLCERDRHPLHAEGRPERRGHPVACGNRQPCGYTIPHGVESRWIPQPHHALAINTNPTTSDVTRIKTGACAVFPRRYLESTVSARCGRTPGSVGSRWRVRAVIQGRPPRSARAPVVGDPGDRTGPDS